MGRARYGVPDEIKEAADSFYRAVSSGNLKAIDTIWAHEPYSSVAGPGGELHQGWPAVSRYWEQRFRQRNGTRVAVKLVHSVCHAVGDVGWLSGTELRTTTEDQREWRQELRMTAILERKGARWQMVSYHASMPTEAPLASAS